jgi:hypothetical protein
MFPFYDQNKAVIGDGRTSQTPQLTDIQWRGNQREGADGAFSKNGVVVDPDGTDAAELDTVLTVLEELERTFGYLCEVRSLGVRWPTPRRPVLRRI